jgi:FMN reductase
MKVVGILGSPSAVSRSASLLLLAQSRLQSLIDSYEQVALRSLPADALVLGRSGHPGVSAAIASVLAADVIFVATPIYKAAYSGLLKIFLDLLPADALRGKSVLPLATGGTIAHLLALDYALKPVLSALGARDILDSVYAADSQIVPHTSPGFVASAELAQRLDISLEPLFERAGRAAPASRASREPSLRSTSPDHAKEAS